MSEKSFGRSFVLLLLVFLILLAYQVAYDHYPVFGDKYRNFTLFNGWAGNIASDSVQVQDETAVIPVISDTAMLIIETDSLAREMTGQGPDSALSVISAGLDHFAQALNELATGKRKKVRIAWFGDSMIEGDLIVMTLRNEIQKQFGGQGVGMVPMTSPVAGFRITVRQSFSDNWQEWNVVNQKPSRFPPGLFCTVHSGNVKDSNDQFWVKFKASNTFKTTSVFQHASLLYGTPAMAKENHINGPLRAAPKVDLYAGEQLLNSFPLDTTGRLHKLDLFSSPLQEFTIYLNSDSAVPYYGVSIESDSGVFVDNFASRGNSGIGLWQINDNLLRQFQGLLQYDLVILQFGTNAMSPGMTEYSWYGHSMNKVLAKLQQGFAGSSFLIISVADRAMKGENGMQTDPGVPEMVNVQRRMAVKNGMEFLDLYSAMGGEGTIVRWAELEEPLANKDYTHVNFKGARKISDIILSHLIQAYRSSELKAETEMDTLTVPVPAITDTNEPAKDTVQ